jgi:hypothetical protein
MPHGRLTINWALCAGRTHFIFFYRIGVGVGIGIGIEFGVPQIFG